ncbi:CmcJ/NvfI family oxidoreductase [uncultured Parasphingorhabdus sp.]|uniref:CmcJ/NvfI family oxidoreductase n=1 Tax=uncultured Parasphingorhabdus sp. TaxID=2709694 RepID=UPI002AA7166F|nr:CmcJ/NvfI family oxidoreductase [uncultured Parasphingorhabdus sp.]
MTARAIVNYYVAGPQDLSVYIDPDGAAGRVDSPELQPVQVEVEDARSGIRPIFAQDSLAFRHSPSAVSDFGENAGWHDDYERELEALLAREIGGKEVVIFDHTVRIDDPDSTRRPARNVHSDYSAAGAHQRLRDILGDARAAIWEAGRFGFVNVWRPVGKPVANTPLGFVRPRSVSSGDWLPVRLVYPDRTGAILGLAANDQHEWIYFSAMAPNDVAIFNIYDNSGLAPIAHSALDIVDDRTSKSTRTSIESRTLVRY